MSAGNDLVRMHLESNRQSQDAWGRFAAHRSRVTGLLLDVLCHGAGVCVIGAGNVNDLDLRRVAARAGRIALIDVDDGAMAAALARQGIEPGHGVELCCADAFGVVDALGPGEDPLGAVARHELAFGDGSFDVVLSAGALTQAFQSLVESSLDADRRLAVTIAVRDHHLLELTRLLRPGGHAILVTDTVATSTAPHLDAAARAGDLEAEMAALVAGGNFFTGTNPYRVLAVLEEDEALRGAGVEDATLHDPWLWPVTPDRQHLTYAVTWRRR